MRFKAIWLCLLVALTLTLPSPSITQPRDPARSISGDPCLHDLQPGKSRLSPGRGACSILTSRVTVEGRVVVIERSLVERALHEEKPTRLDEAAATKIGMRVGADYIVLGSITKIGDYISLDARLISLTEEKPPLTAFTQHKGIDDVMVKIGDFAQDIGYKILGRRPAIGSPGGPRQRRGTESIDRASIDFKKSQTFKFEMKGIDVGDVDGDKKNEVVVMDECNLYIFKYDGEKLSFFQKIEAGSQYNFLTLDVADVNRNGFAEIIVTAVVEDDVRSFIFEYEQGKFRKIADKANWFFRVLEHPKEGPVLMGQRRGSEGMMTGPVFKFIWKKTSFEKGPKLTLPKETKVRDNVGFTLGDIRGNGKNEIITFDLMNRLTIVSDDGKIQWKSQSKLLEERITSTIRKRKQIQVSTPGICLAGGHIYPEESLSGT